MPKTKSRSVQHGETTACVYSDFQKAKNALVEAIGKGPLYALLTGASGSGKTSVLREVAAALDRHRFQAHYLSQSRTSASGVARFLCEALHLSPRRSHAQTLSAMCEALEGLPFRVVLLVDEANHLPVEALEEIRLLAESELDSPPLFSVVFSGLPELKRKLETPSLFPLKRRLSLRVELHGLKSEEVVPFLSARLGQEVEKRFSPQALSVLFERAQGIPAVLEDLAKLLLERFEAPTTITVESLAEMLEDWEL